VLECAAEALTASESPAARENKVGRVSARVSQLRKLSRSRRRFLARKADILERGKSAYSVEKLGFPLRALFRIPGIDTDNCGQVFAEANREDLREAIAVGR